jgi:uncharacterized protein (DUF1778 family)
VTELGLHPPHTATAAHYLALLGVPTPDQHGRFPVLTADTVRTYLLYQQPTVRPARLLPTAVAYGRPNMASFIIENVLPTARQTVVDRAERIVLSERDTVRVLVLLENPPKPTPALMDAARRRAVREMALMDSREKPIGRQVEGSSGCRPR